MNQFISIFLLAFRRLFSKKNIFVLSILFGILMLGVHKGAVESSKLWEASREFKKIEYQLFSKIPDYANYSVFGVRIFFLPPTQGVLFPNPVQFSGLSGKVNSIFSLDIFNNCRDSTVMKGNSMLKFRFSSLVIVLGSLAVLLIGAAPFRHREFLKFLSSGWSPKMLFLSIMLSRIIIIAFTLLVILGCALLLLMVENIPLSGADFSNILCYLILTYLVLVFFFVLGTILGNLQNKIGLFAGILVLWFFLVFFWPGVVDSIIEDKAGKITSSYKTDTQKLQTVNEFEDIYIKERGGFKNYTREEARDIVKGYVKNVFPKIEAMDEKQEAEIAAVIQDHMDLSVIVPTTFYNSTCNELSGRGYGNYLNFSKYLREQRREFLLFWIDRVYYHDPKEMKNFVTGDENIFRGRGMKPQNFWTGCLIIMGWIILLGSISYVLYKRSLVCMKTSEIKKLGKVDLKFEPGNVNVKLAKGIALIHALYSIFSGNIKYLTKKGFKGEVFLGNTNMTDKTKPNGFIYICHPESLPGDIKTRDLLKFYGRWTRQTVEQMKKVLSSEIIKDNLDQPIYKLERDQKYEVVISLLEMSRSPVFLIDNITADMPLNDLVRFKNRVDELARQGATVVYVTTPRIVVLKTIEMKNYFDDGDAWVYSVKSHEQGLKVQGKKIDKKRDQ
jgi:ABC-type transport system involved in cytochrome c biogenesis ATPase subunit/ABC-type transport system involved in multi-copper enzyme maturation permease subunit